MKHILEMTVVLLAATCVVAQSPKPATQTAKPATAGAAHKPAADKPAGVKVNPGPLPFDIVSAKRIDSVESHSFGNSIAFTDDNVSGVMVVLKSKSPGTLMYYSTDFSLGFESANFASEIPRRPCIGISNDTSASPENDWDWLLGGGVARGMVVAEKPYFAVVLSAPKNVSEFTLYYAQPAGAKIKLAK
jgi:hypothetical protein